MMTLSLITLTSDLFLLLPQILLTQGTEYTQKEPSSGDVDVAVPVADWNDDVHVVNLWTRRYKDVKVRNCILR